MFETEKALASSWFKSLRDEIVSAFKQIEIDHLSGPFSDEAPGIFEVKETERTADDGSDAGGGHLFGVAHEDPHIGHAIDRSNKAAFNTGEHLTEHQHTDHKSRHSKLPAKETAETLLDKLLATIGYRLKL